MKKPNRYAHLLLAALIILDSTVVRSGPLDIWTLRNPNPVTQGSRKVAFGNGLYVTVGDFAYIGADTIIGHDSIVCNYVHIGMRCFIGGRVKIGEGATIHPMATIVADIVIGEGAVVAAGAVVFGNVPAHTTVLGNPAKKFDFKRE